MCRRVGLSEREVGRQELPAGLDGKVLGDIVLREFHLPTLNSYDDHKTPKLGRIKRDGIAVPYGSGYYLLR